MTILEAQQQFNLELHFFKPVAECYVVYFLLYNNEIVYIGKSSDTAYLGRIRSHRKDKLFDSYAVATTNLTEQQCLDFETSLISLVQPKYNKKDSFFNLHRIVNGINTYYNVNNLATTPESEQINSATKSYQNSALQLMVAFIVFNFTCMYLTVYQVYDKPYLLFTALAAFVLSGINARVKLKRLKHLKHQLLQN